MFFINKNKKKSHFKYFILLIVTFFVLLVISRYKNEIIKIFYPLDYSKYVFEYSHEYGLDPYLVFSIMKVESRFNKDAESHKGAKGLMQITDDTGEWIAKQIKIEDYNNSFLFDPEHNIQMGCWYLSKLIKRFDGDIKLAIAAYNAGGGNVEKWLGDDTYSHDGKSLHTIPFGETEKYIIKVSQDYNIYKNLYSSK